MTQSTLPSPSSGYGVGLTTPLTPELWAATVSDLHRRVQVLEGIKVSFQAIENAGIGAALNRIDVVIGPAIEAVNLLVADANAKLAAIEATRTTAEQVLAELQASGLDADNVNLEGIAGLEASNAQAAFAEIVGLLQALSTSMAEALASEASARTDAIAAEAEARATDIANNRASYATVQKFL